MNEFIGKLIIFLSCTFFNIGLLTLDTGFIAITLIAFITGYIDVLFTKKAHFPIILYLIACLFYPNLCIYLPFILWDIRELRLRIGLCLYGINLIALIVRIPESFTITYILFIIFSSFITLFMRQIIVENNNFNLQLKTLRDNSKEHELLIEEKNKVLVENQDNTIHLATLKERNRIAREIHDNVGHMITRSILQTGAIKTINKDANLDELLQNLQDTLNTAMTNIRESVHDLHDESVNLEAAIKEIVNNTLSPAITFIYDIDSVIPRKIKYCFISVIKEAVNNTTKHSNADKMSILLREHPGFFQLLIEDNGTNIHTNYENGIGLNNISDRVNSLGGNLKISHDKGFSIRITINK